MPLKSLLSIVLALAVPATLALALPVSAQRGGRGGGSPAQNAPIDVTGYWVSVVTEDWRFRMVTPPRGEYGGVPLNGAARSMANAWDPEADEAAGEACRSYGAPAIMRVPARFHVFWEDDVLRIDVDSGTQTRVFRFDGEEPGGDPTWQGHSLAEWERSAAGRGDVSDGSLRVLTTHLRPGYLRKNGVPYSGATVLTEYFDRVSGPDGDEWLVVTTIVDDPVYLTTPFITSTHFRREADGSGWSPTPCQAG
jgi:hypothetical protein